MIQKFSRDEFNIQCDKCGYDEMLPAQDFEDATAEARARGWKNFKEKSGWENRCPDCTSPAGVFSE